MVLSASQFLLLMPHYRQECRNSSSGVGCRAGNCKEKRTQAEQ